MRVRVYWNLHKRCFSVQDAKTGRVIKHTDFITLRDVSFVVRPAGNQKVRETGKKNVHAFVVGETTDGLLGQPVAVSGAVTYNPYRDTTFVEKTHERKPIHAADFVQMAGYPGFPVVTAYYSERGVA